jgi:hypothetical protein
MKYQNDFKHFCEKRHSEAQHPVQKVFRIRIQEIRICNLEMQTSLKIHRKGSRKNPIRKKFRF